MSLAVVPAPIIRKLLWNVHQARRIELPFQEGDSLGKVSPDRPHKIEVAGVKIIVVSADERPADISIATMCVYWWA